MNWQDFVFATGGAFFALALVPIVRNPEARLPRRTSVPTAFWIAVFAVAHYSIGFYWASLTEATSALMWGFIAWKRATWSKLTLVSYRDRGLSDAD